MPAMRSVIMGEHPQTTTITARRQTIVAGVQFEVGHGCYSWLSWLQQESPQRMVDMEYAHPCEPYVIALSDALPRYDERFRGRGQNKVQQLTHMAMWGFRCVALSVLAVLSECLDWRRMLRVPHGSFPVLLYSSASGAALDDCSRYLRALAQHAAMHL